MSSVTSNYSFPKPGVDSSTNTWGTELNNALDLIDSTLYARENQIIARVERNYVINPCFIINQEYGAGTLTVNTGTAYFSDMWYAYLYSGAAPTLSMSYARLGNGFDSTSTYNNASIYYGRFGVIAKHDTNSTSDLMYIENRIEGYDYESLHGETSMALSFWARTNRTGGGTFCVSVANNANSRSYVINCTLTSNDWEYKYFSIPNDTSGTWEIGSSIGIRVRFCLWAGSNYNTTSPETWLNFDKYRTFSQVNFVNTTSNYLDFTQVKLEAGANATRFQQRLYQEELKLCERYYEKSYNLTDIATLTGAVTNDGMLLQCTGVYGTPVGATNTSVSPGQLMMNIRFRTRKRTIPTYYNVFSNVTGLAEYVRNGGDMRIDYNVVGETGFVVTNHDSITSGGEFRRLSCHYVASSKL